MKGLIFDIKRFAVHDGPGIRTTIFFKGCPLRCWWCHNPESCSIDIVNIQKYHNLDGIKYKHQEKIGKYYSVSEIMTEVEKEAVFYDESGGGVTLSGGEPLLQSEFAINLLRSCQEKGFHTALDTSGFVKKDKLEIAAKYADLILYDLKHHDNEKHKQYTGVDNTVVLKNLRLLIMLGKSVRVRIPIVPGINDGDTDMEEFANILKDMNFNGQVDLLPFHNMADSKYQNLLQKNKLIGLARMKKSDLIPKKNYFESLGFKVKIGG